MMWYCMKSVHVWWVEGQGHKYPNGRNKYLHHCHLQSTTTCHHGWSSMLLSKGLPLRPPTSPTWALLIFLEDNRFKRDWRKGEGSQITLFQYILDLFGKHSWFKVYAMFAYCISANVHERRKLASPDRDAPKIGQCFSFMTNVRGLINKRIR